MLMKKFKVLFTAMVWVLATIAVSAQNVVVSGSVKDEDGAAVVGANVVLKGSSTVYTMTDVAGGFRLSVPSDGILVVNSLGYQTAEVPVAGRRTVDIVLASDSQLLDETIVVAFGTTTKEAFTGSATVIKSDELLKRQTTNVTNALVGNVAGLQIRGASGAPGAGSGSINIRGISSIYAGTDPLVIVDGAPYSASLSNIPQSDIESVTVLKDAASAALYGARGAAGVIIVTTKKGRNNDAVVNFDARVGINSRAIQDYDVIKDPGAFYEAYYAQLYNQRFYGQGYSATEANLYANEKMISDLGYQVFTVPEGEQIIGLDGKLNPNATLGYAIKDADTGETYWLTPDDWTKSAYKNAMRQEYNVSVTGGNDKASFYASFGYLNEDGIIEYSGYERISARIKADYQAKKWLKVGANVGYVNSLTTSNPNMSASQLGSTNLMYYTSRIAPIYPIYVRVLDDNGNPVIRTDANGNPQYDYGVSGKDYPVDRAFLQTGNPLGSNRYNVSQSKGNQLNGNMTVDIDITNFLKFNVTSTAILGTTNQTVYDTALYCPKVGVNGELDKYSSLALRTKNLQTLT